MSRIWFSNSGSEGNDSAARIVWYYWNSKKQPKRRKMISHLRAYHGNTIASASLCQVYKAKTKNNNYLAVKVQRPN